MELTYLGTATLSLRHGDTRLLTDPAFDPNFTPQVYEVTGFLLDVDDGPRVWISGDTVFIPALAATLAEIRQQRPVDLAVVHCGAVGFPRVPGLGDARFTFDAAEAIAACRVLDPGLYSESGRQNVPMAYIIPRGLQSLRSMSALSNISDA